MPSNIPDDLPAAGAAKPGGRFDPRTPWSPGAAALAAVVVLAVAIAVSMFAAVGIGTLLWGVKGQSSGQLGGQSLGMATLACMQAVIIAGMLWLAGWYGGKRREVLSLELPPATAWLVAPAVMLAVLLPYNVAVWLLWPNTFTQDLRPFADMARSDAVWIAFAAVGIGAPLSEELMFRGFLLSALARNRWGFPAAALLTTFGWTLLHFSYSVVGLTEVFIVGLLFSWLMWWYGSLWLLIGLHALYNGGQMVALMLIDI